MGTSASFVASPPHTALHLRSNRRQPHPATPPPPALKYPRPSAANMDEDWSHDAVDLPFEEEPVRNVNVGSLIDGGDEESFGFEQTFRGAAIVSNHATFGVSEVEFPGVAPEMALSAQPKEAIYQSSQGFSLGGADDFAFAAPAPSVMSAAQLFGAMPGVEVLDALDAPPPTSAPRPSSSVFSAAAPPTSPQKKQSIQPLSKCPIKSYTTLNLAKECDPCLVTAKMQQACASLGPNVNCQMLQEGLKLKGSVGVPRGGGQCEESSLDVGGGSFFFVFQLFWKDDAQSELVCVWRRLCGDPVAFNDYYRKAVSALKNDADLAPFLTHP